MAKNPANWEYSGAMKAGGRWGYFETHLPTGISRFDEKRCYDLSTGVGQDLNHNSN